MYSIAKGERARKGRKKGEKERGREREQEEAGGKRKRKWVDKEKDKDRKREMGDVFFGNQEQHGRWMLKSCSSSFSYPVCLDPGRHHYTSFIPQPSASRNCRTPLPRSQSFRLESCRLGISICIPSSSMSVSRPSTAAWEAAGGHA